MPGEPRNCGWPIPKITKSSLETIHRLSRAAEYKDEDTGAHILRMSHYSSLLARKLGLKKVTVERILYAAPMHDVGKIGIPGQDTIETRPADRGGMGDNAPAHHHRGGSILEGAEAGFIKLAEVIALTHHEKWDGSGYPLGLKGEAIPLARTHCGDCRCF